MARPVVSPISEQMYEGLYPLAFEDEAHNWALLHFCEAFIGSLQDVEDVARDDLNVGAFGAPGWSGVLDVDRAPYEGLPWLGQFVGLTTPARMIGETEAAHDARLRGYIRATGGFNRGTPASIIGAVQQFLTGSKSVMLTERDSSAYHFDIRSRLGQTPVEDWPATNLITNGGFETNVTGYSVTAATLARSTAQQRFDAASALYTITTGGADSFFSPTVTISGSTAGRKYASSVWVYASGTTVGKTIRLGFRETGGAAALNEVITSTVLVNGWQRLITLKTIIQNDRTGLLFWVSLDSSVTGQTLYFDGAQIEENALATPYIETNGSTASRISGMGNIRKAIDAQKPAGLQYLYTAIPDWTYDDLDARAATYNALEALYSTYDQMEVHP